MNALSVDAKQGLEEFCRSEHHRLVGMLSLLCGDRDVAEDLTQEVLVRVWRNWDKVAQLDNPSGWAYRVAVNLTTSWFRTRTVRLKAVLKLRGEESHYDPDTASAVAVRQTVAGLPRRQRTALVLRYYADLSVKEVAAVMGCPEGTVKTLTARAVKGLRLTGLEVADE